jgi:hypothetical protein
LLKKGGAETLNQLPNAPGYVKGSSGSMVKNEFEDYLDYMANTGQMHENSMSFAT